ncbi:pLS20_p028 family conjugation system transmembrane protein [Enterococcus hulanensis]|uniref:pLS20_p028 family conjugation system transmembrane protein n=1 Tax=Enterococcus hulanensis TaxID=2559929 RepID=UPI0010F9D849|nr:hypothetical protein [Enterococcus hulanensis]
MSLRKKIPIFFSGILLTFVISWNTAIAAGMKDGEILDILDKYSGYLTKGNMAWDITRPIGLSILTGVAKILDGLSNTLGELIKLLNFVDNSEFQALLDKVEPIKWGLLLLFLIGFFVLIMFNKVNDGFQAPLNMVLLICLSIMLPFFFSTMSTLTQDIFTELTTSFESPGSSIILQNTTDLKAVAEEGWKMKDGENLNHYKKIRQLDMEEKLQDPDKIKNGDPLAKRIETDSKGKDKVVNIDKAKDMKEYLVKKVFSENYYRNKVWMGNALATLLVMIAALAFTAIKFAILIHKMYGDYVLVFVGGISDFMNMQRVKALFAELAGTFALIVYIPILTQCYLIAVSIINAQNFSFVTYIIAMIGAAIALIDGPNGFQRVTGIDAGLKSSAGLIATTLGGSKLANKAVDMTTNAARSAGNLLTDAAAFGLGAFAGGASDDKSKGINDDDSKDTDNEEEKPTGINEGNPEDNDNEATDNGPNPDDDSNEETEPENTGDSESTDQSLDGDDVGNENDGPGAINDQDGDPFYDSLDNQEPPSENDVESGINDPVDNPLANGNEEDGQHIKQSPTGINDQVALAGDSGDKSQNELSNDDIEPTGLNDGEVKSDPTIANEDSAPPEPNVGPTQVDHELNELNKSNPLRKELKHKVFGYDQNDPRRWSKETTIERKKSAFEAGNEYRKYRQRKKELKERKRKE